ncbi:MAG: arylsulfatase A-like enzyme [Candidatus Latescibacterota bacterium]|jgi:arylsulfatase A-like enzyme
MSDKKNILFMFADQMHAFAMGCMGTDDIHTPNLDQLAKEGVLFRNCYSNAPVCTPFRASLVSGRYGSQTDTLRNTAYIPEGTRTLAGALNDGGYRTGWVGKWHLGASGNVWIPPELRADFTEFIGYQCYNDFLHGVKFYDEEGEEHWYDRHRTDVTTDIAIERLEGMKEGPFALFVSYQTPHYPEQPAWVYDQMYKGKTIKRRPNCEDVDPYIKTASPPSPKPKENDPLYQRYGNNLDEYLRAYYAMVTQLDANVGRLLEALDRLGLRDSTVVMFTSDHGDMQGSHGLTQKSLPWEESSHVPLVVRTPGGAEGAVVDDLVSGVDFFATCVDYAGLPPEPSVEGDSFASMVADPSKMLNRPIFSEMRPWCLVREGAFKLVVQKDGFEATHLFDLEHDPYEMDNLLGKSEHAERQLRLFGLLQDWHKRVNEGL